MAIIQYTAIVNQIRGKLNGSQFNKGRTSYVLQSKASQTSQVKGKQSVSRSEFAYVQRTWKSLPSATKLAWAQVAENNPDFNRFGEQVRLSGYNKFIQSLIRSRANGFEPANPPLTAPAPAFVFSDLSVTGLAFSQNAQGEVSASGTITVSSPDININFIICAYISYPYSSGITEYYNTYIKLWHDRSATDFVVVFNELIGGRYPMPQAGQLIQFKFMVLYTGNGVRVQEQTIQVQI